MSSDLQHELLDLAHAQGLPAEVAGQAYTFIQGQGEEAVSIDLNGQSTSTKFANLRWRLRAFLYEVAKTGYALSKVDDLMAAALLVVPFLKKARELATYPIGKQEARVLANLFLLEFEHQPTDLDHLLALLDGLKQEDVQTSLNLLEALGCVECTQAGAYAIKEEVHFKHALPSEPA